MKIIDIDGAKDIPVDLINDVFEEVLLLYK